MKNTELIPAIIEKIQTIETPKGRRVVSILRGHESSVKTWHDEEDVEFHRARIVKEVEAAIETGLRMNYITEDNASDIRTIYA